jgi:hypothetical protein
MLLKTAGLSREEVFLTPVAELNRLDFGGSDIDFFFLSFADPFFFLLK